jgi:N-acetylmuramoyl-L-alanine amidase
MMKRKYSVILILLFAILSSFAQDKDTPQSGEGIYAFLRRHNREGAANYDEFIKLNKSKLGKNNSLLNGVTYLLPTLVDPTETNKQLSKQELEILESLDYEQLTKKSPDPQTKTKQQTYRLPLFGKKYEEYTVKDNLLSGACFFLVSGHGGPDSGAIAKVDGHSLHEDEYAYDIVLRLARSLLEHGATVHIIIQDPKDGIRDDKYLNNSKKETCMGEPLPLNQLERLKQRCKAVNTLSRKAKEKYQRAIFIHLDSRSKKQQLDVFFYYQSEAANKKKSKLLAETMAKTFEEQYNKHQPGRGFSGTVSTRPLYVMKKASPVAIFVELANMQNVNDQRRYLSDNNRQALANWLSMGFIKDYQQSQ